MKKNKSIGDRVEDIEVKIWNLQAQLMNSDLFFAEDKVIKALNDAGVALYNYRQSGGK